MKLTNIQSSKIQILRGIAIIAVVCIHSAPGGLSQVFIRPFLNYCVGMFLFISGMLSDPQRWHAKKRIIKILIPYVLWTLIYSLFNSYRSMQLFPLNFLKSLMTASSSAVMYYVFVYIQLTLLIPVIAKLARSKFYLLGFLISPLEILSMKTIPALTGYGFNGLIEKVIDVSCIGWFIFFYLGYVLGNEIVIPNRHTSYIYIYNRYCLAVR